MVMKQGHLNILFMNFRWEYDPSKYEVADANQPEPSYDRPDKYDEKKPRDYQPKEEENNVSI